ASTVPAAASGVANCPCEAVVASRGVSGAQAESEKPSPTALIWNSYAVYTGRPSSGDGLAQMSGTSVQPPPPVWCRITYESAFSTTSHVTGTDVAVASPAANDCGASRGVGSSAAVVTSSGGCGAQSESGNPSPTALIWNSYAVFAVKPSTVYGLAEMSGTWFHSSPPVRHWITYDSASATSSQVNGTVVAVAVPAAKASGAGSGVCSAAVAIVKVSDHGEVAPPSPCAWTWKS